MAVSIAVLPGDGIGPEITAPTLEVLSRLGDFAFTEHPFGGASIDAHGTALTDDTLAACRAADAVLLAAVGGPKWDTTDPNAPRPEQGLLGLRKELGLYANLRPVRAIDALLEASRLWREVVHRVHAEEFPQIEIEHALVDSTAMKLITAPRHFDVILTENMFGDILSDEASVVTGSLGLLPSASIGGDGPGLFEPVHGSAPDIAGQGIANPLAMFLSAALMLRHGLGRAEEAAALESAVDRALDGGLRTPDLGGTAGP